MFTSRSFLTNTRLAHSIALCAFLFLVATQSISLAHEFTHSDHEPTELCDVLGSFGSNKAVIAVEFSYELSFQNPIGFNALPFAKLSAKGISTHRSRAPPATSVI